MPRKHPVSELPKEQKPTEKPVDPKLKEAVDSHSANLDGVVLKVLGNCLGSDMRFYDVNYVTRRIIQIIEESYPKITFVNNQLSSLQKNYFMEKARDIKKSTSIPTFEKDSREEKCEPLCHSIIDDVFDDVFMFNDSKWLDAYMEASNKMFVIELVKHYFETLFSKLDFSLGKSFMECEDILFGVPKSQLSLKQMDEIIKSKGFAKSEKK